MAWSFENGIPIYQQIITELKMQIAAGTYQPDDRLPPVRELAMDAGVNPNTMQRALAQMEQEGVLYTN
ncbi:GntR family transcriptional regulator, partial [Porcincola intestinalis]